MSNLEQTLQNSLLPTTQVVTDDQVLGGMEVVAGTRVPAATILDYLRHDRSTDDIREDYPSLPVDGVEAVEIWARRKFGATWRSIPPSASA